MHRYSVGLRVGTRRPSKMPCRRRRCNADPPVFASRIAFCKVHVVRRPSYVTLSIQRVTLCHAKTREVCDDVEFSAAWSLRR